MFFADRYVFRYTCIYLKKGQEVDPNFEDCFSLKPYCNFKYLLLMVNTSLVDG